MRGRCILNFKLRYGFFFTLRRVAQRIDGYANFTHEKPQFSVTLDGTVTDIHP